MYLWRESHFLNFFDRIFLSFDLSVKKEIKMIFVYGQSFETIATVSQKPRQIFDKLHHITECDSKSTRFKFKELQK